MWPKECRTQKQRIDYAREKVTSHYHNQDEWEFLYWLIHQHPEADDKIGCGVSDIIIEPNKFNPNAFHMSIVRDDESVVAISWNTCARGVGKSKKTTFALACRFAVSKDVGDYAYKRREDCCDLCGNVSTMHVDHEDPKFRDIVDNFLRDNNFKIDDIELVDRPADMGGVKFAKKEMSTLFLKYHNSVAKLRWLCQACNLRER